MTPEDYTTKKEKETFIVDREFNNMSAKDRKTLNDVYEYEKQNGIL